MFLSFICFYIFKNGSYFSFICLVGCFQFFFFFFVLIVFHLFGVDLLSWFGWWQVFLFCNFIE
ncbi:hypothetical protein D6U70_15125 [Vibrio cholerae]|nr:hypothetical protein [Vibrio cholerae]